MTHTTTTALNTFCANTANLIVVNGMWTDGDRSDWFTVHYNGRTNSVPAECCLLPLDNLNNPNLQLMHTEQEPNTMTRTTKTATTKSTVTTDEYPTMTDTNANELTYRDLQVILKAHRANGTKLTCKLNAKYEVLHAEVERLGVVVDTPADRDFEEEPSAAMVAEYAELVADEVKVNAKFERALHAAKELAKAAVNYVQLHEQEPQEQVLPASVHTTKHTASTAAADVALAKTATTVNEFKLAANMAPRHRACRLDSRKPSAKVTAVAPMNKARLEYTKSSDCDQYFTKPVSRVTSPKLQKRLEGWANALPPESKQAARNAKQAVKNVAAFGKGLAQGLRNA